MKINVEEAYHNHETEIQSEKERNLEYNRTKIAHSKAGPTLPKGGAGRRLGVGGRCPIRSSLLSLRSQSGLSYLNYNCIYFIFELTSES